MKIKGPYKIVWKDHASFSLFKWRDFEESDLLDGDFIVESYGFIVKETKDYIVLSPHFNIEFGQTTGEMKILKGTIIKKKKLKEK